MLSAIGGYMENDKTGDMAWLDLTVPNATEVRYFYQEVIGWESEACSMGDYDDYTMMSKIDGKAKAGVCHTSGPNADLPAVWMPYFLVEDMTTSVAKVKEHGGSLLTEVKSMGPSDTYVVIKDPSGAVCALYDKS